MICIVDHFGGVFFRGTKEWPSTISLCGLGSRVRVNLLLALLSVIPNDYFRTGGKRYHILLTKTPHTTRTLRTILFGGLGLGLRVGVLGVVRVCVRVRVSIRAWGKDQFGVRVRFRVRVGLGLGLLLGLG